MSLKAKIYFQINVLPGYEWYIITWHKYEFGCSLIHKPPSLVNETMLKIPCLSLCFFHEDEIEIFHIIILYLKICTKSAFTTPTIRPSHSASVPSVPNTGPDGVQCMFVFWNNEWWSNKGRKDIQLNKIFTYWCVPKVDLAFYLLEIIKEGRRWDFHGCLVGTFKRQQGSVY